VYLPERVYWQGGLMTSSSSTSQAYLCSLNHPPAPSLSPGEMKMKSSVVKIPDRSNSNAIFPPAASAAVGPAARDEFGLVALCVPAVAHRARRVVLCTCRGRVVHVQLSSQSHRACRSFGIRRANSSEDRFPPRRFRSGSRSRSRKFDGLHLTVGL
jgi:hypothetical protein